ncbi:phorbol ester/diacylglycerol-binding protein unc-13-like isoform X1 [Arapaima gigas]
MEGFWESCRYTFRHQRDRNLAINHKNDLESCCTLSSQFSLEIRTPLDLRDSRSVWSGHCSSTNFIQVTTEACVSETLPGLHPQTPEANTGERGAMTPPTGCSKARTCHSCGRTQRSTAQTEVKAIHCTDVTQDIIGLDEESYFFFITVSD